MSQAVATIRRVPLNWHSNQDIVYRDLETAMRAVDDLDDYWLVALRDDDGWHMIAIDCKGKAVKSLDTPYKGRIHKSEKFLAIEEQIMEEKKHPKLA